MNTYMRVNTTATWVLECILSQSRFGTYVGYSQYFGDEGEVGEVGEYFGDEGDICAGAANSQVWSVA